MRPLAQILERIFSDPKLKSHFIEGAVSGIWKQAVGERIARVASPVSFDNGTLYVRVSSAAWRNELHMMQQQMIDSLNAKLGRNEIERIIFR
ncbi:MAG: DUF721 domain-containing protein [candidate division KSB1 bacterium]|nr:DUF721 domain-containing protein [candidate division KSB1 bacterium]MDQ7065505.1 DUF721 domain-containing protein [candidate division KSB1 bacterium]